MQVAHGFGAAQHFMPLPHTVVRQTELKYTKLFLFTFSLLGWSPLYLATKTEHSSGQNTRYLRYYEEYQLFTLLEIPGIQTLMKDTRHSHS